jgi:hypothetical protein
MRLNWRCNSRDADMRTEDNGSRAGVESLLRRPAPGSAFLESSCLGYSDQRRPADDAAKVRFWRFLALVYLEDPPTRRLG